jgi:hypothetical protein
MEEGYLVEFRYPENSFYCIWCDTDIEVFLLVSEKLFYREQLGDVKEYCYVNEIGLLNDAATIYNVGEIEKWANSNLKEIDVSQILTFWNIIDDYAKALEIEFSGNKDEMWDIYEKIFYGNNLPSINTSGSLYKPKWTKKELLLIKGVIEEGLDLLRAEFFTDK